MNWEERSKSQTPHELSGNGHDGRSETTDGVVVARVRIRADELQALCQKENESGEPERPTFERPCTEPILILRILPAKDAPTGFTFGWVA